MRKKHDVLMEAGKPVNGQWNFDSENRKKLPKIINQPSICFNDVSEILNEVKKTNKTIGSVDAENFVWPINRAIPGFVGLFVKNVCIYSEVIKML
jgi:deoxyribodipyrimidine photolyase-related protein